MVGLARGDAGPQTLGCRAIVMRLRHGRLMKHVPENRVRMDSTTFSRVAFAFGARSEGGRHRAAACVACVDDDMEDGDLLRCVVCDAWCPWLLRVRSRAHVRSGFRRLYY
eukprot:2293203-Prymnesium_polylepis.1